MLQALNEANTLERTQIERILENIISISHLHFVVLKQEGDLILQIGSAPESLSLNAPEGKSFDGSELLLWRKIPLRNKVKGDLNGKGEMVDLMNDAADPVMILGFNVPEESHILMAAKKSIFLTSLTALMFIFISLITWIMVIRSRLFARQLEAERAHRAHLEELGLAAAGLAHETKNPLGIILGLAQQISANPKEPEQSRIMLDHIIDEVDKAQARLGSFMTFARMRKVNAVFVDFQEVALNVAEILQPDFDAAGISLTIDSPALNIFADAEMLRQVLVNLLLNSLHASSPGEAVTVRTACKGRTATFMVADQGSGISPELLPRIFHPYVSGRAEGHGLGLAIVYRIVEAHGWVIGVDSRNPRGTVITISRIVLREAGV